MLGPGAFAGPSSMSRFVDGLQRRGVAAEAIELPRGRAEGAVATFLAYTGADVVAGGHSFGGRVASLAAAQAPFAALVLFSFPLSGRARERTAHFPVISCPVLLLSGERDELASLAQLRTAASLLPHGRLVTYPAAGHSLDGVLDQALDEAARFVHGLERQSAAGARA